MERAAKRRQIAILDFIMPRLDGVEAALLLRRDCPSTRVAVQSSDPDGLKERAAALGSPSLTSWTSSLCSPGSSDRPVFGTGLGRRPWRRSHRGVTSPAPSVVTASLVASRPNAARCATTTLRGKLLYPRRRTGASADSANARRYVTPQTVRRPRESCRRCRGRGRHGVREGQRDGQ
jgi:CheY-like chemotaxis protein